MKRTWAHESFHDWRKHRKEVPGQIGSGHRSGGHEVSSQRSTADDRRSARRLPFGEFRPRTKRARSRLAIAKRQDRFERRMLSLDSMTERDRRGNLGRHSRPVDGVA